MNEADQATPPGPGYPAPGPGPEPRRLYREPEEKKIAGVCGGLADHFGVDPTLVRLAVVLITLSTGVLLFVYLVAAFVIPERPPSVPRRVAPPSDAATWSNGTKVLLALAAIALIGFGHFDWWFNVPTLAIALVGLGVWLLVAERDQPGGSAFGPPPPTEGENYPPSPDAWSGGGTTVVGDAGPEGGVAGGIDDVPGTGPTGMVDDPTAFGGAATSAAGAGPRGEVPPPIPPWGIGSSPWSEPSGPSGPYEPSGPYGTYGPPGPYGPHHPSGPSTVPRAVARREPKRGGAGLPLGVIGLLFVGAGVLSLIGVLDVGHIGPVEALAGGLLLIGVAMILGAWRGNGRPLIAVGLPLVGLLLVAGLVDVPLDAGTGDHTRVIDSVAELDGTHRLTAGKLTLDLRDLRLGPQARPAPELVADVAFGELIVIVPENAHVEVAADVGLGDVVGDREGDGNEDGLDVRERFDIGGDETGGQLMLDLHVGIGEIEVRRA